MCCLDHGYKHHVTFTFIPYFSKKPASLLYLRAVSFHFSKGVILSQKQIAAGEFSILLSQDGVIQQPSCNEEPGMLQLFQRFPLCSCSYIINSYRVSAKSSHLRRSYNPVGGHTYCWGGGKVVRVRARTSILIILFPVT